MKRLFLILSITILLTGCGLFDRGNYEKNRSGFVINDYLIVKYHTNSIGEIDIFMIDQLFTFFEALEYTDFDYTQLSGHPTVQSYVTIEELDSCGIESDHMIPKFIRIGDYQYVYHIRDNGYCTYDEFVFHEYGYSSEVITNVSEVSPIEITNIQRFKDADFKVNTFEDIVVIQSVNYMIGLNRWKIEDIEVVPMSYMQAGDNYEDLSSSMDEIRVLENYVLANQSINLLTLREDYQDEDVNVIWSEETVEALGRDHEVIKQVRLKNAGDILDTIYDTLSRLGMFQ